MSKTILVIGAGGHGKVVADTILEQREFSLIGFADSYLPIGTKVFDEYKIVADLKNIEILKTFADRFVVAIGNNKVRAEWFEKLSKVLKPAIVIHPSAVVSKFSKIGDGTVLLARSVVNSGAAIGKNCIINSLSLIDHECNVGDHTTAQ